MRRHQPAKEWWDSMGRRLIWQERPGEGGRPLVVRRHMLGGAEWKYCVVRRWRNSLNERRRLLLTLDNRDVVGRRWRMIRVLRWWATLWKMDDREYSKTAVVMRRNEPRKDWRRVRMMKEMIIISTTKYDAVSWERLLSRRSDDRQLWKQHDDTVIDVENDVKPPTIGWCLMACEDD